MKFLFDMIPVIAFFAVYQIPDDTHTGIKYATAAAIIASMLQVIYLWARHRRVERMYLITFGLLLILGGATLLLNDERYIKWKPTAVNWAFAIAFLGSGLFSRRNLLQRMMDSNVALPERIWARLNLAWVCFFVVVGALNLYVAYQFETTTWVNFKMFGVLGLTVLFAIAQGFYMMRHLQVEDEPADAPSAAPIQNPADQP